MIYMALADKIFGLMITTVVISAVILNSLDIKLIKATKTGKAR